MVTGIMINGVLRDTLSQFNTIYNRVFGKDFEGAETFSDVLNRIRDTKDEELFNFVFSDESLAIFGHAKEAEKNGMLAVKQFLEYMSNSNNRLVLISKELYYTIPATLFFLSKIGSTVPEVRFVKSNEEIMPLVDFLITEDPELIRLDPEKCVKLKRPYNEALRAGEEIESLRDMVDKITALKEAAINEKNLNHSTDNV